ncbi:hypothetical protein Tco_0667017 [Tanacetum coccineum]
MSSTEVGTTTAATIHLVTSSVALIPEHEGSEYADSISAANVHTRRPAKRFVISSDTHDSNANAADDEVSSIVRYTVPSSTVLIPAILTTTIATTVVTGTSIPRPRDVNEATHASIFADSTSAAYVPKWDVLNDSLLDDSNVCRSVVDQLAPPVFFLQLCAMEYDQLLSEFNVGAARQIMLSDEVRIRLGTLLRGKNGFGREAEEAVRACELGSLKEQSVAFQSTAACDDLSIKAYTLEREKDKLIDHVSSLEVTCSELRGEVSGYQLFKERIEEMQDA